MLDTPIAILQSIIHHNAESGHMIWKERTPDMYTQRGQLSAVSMCRSFNTKFANTPALACLDKGTGYLCGNIFGKRHQAHRVLWALTHEEWPDADIDHINGVRHDNRISNLRPVTRAENLKNVMRRRSNSSGFNGVSWASDRGKWRAEIQANGTRVKLGSFDTLEEAIARRIDANLRYGFHPNHGMR